LLVRFFGHSCGLLSATHQPFSTTKMRFFVKSRRFNCIRLSQAQLHPKPLWNRNTKTGNRKCDLSRLLRLSQPCFPPSQIDALPCKE
jgi:hypothetical protein